MPSLIARTFSRRSGGLREWRRQQELYRRGQELAAAGQPEAAIETFRAALFVNSGDIPSRLALANLLSQTGEQRAALSEIETVLGQKPRQLPAFMMKGQIQLAMSRATEAAETLQKCIAVSSKNADAWNVLGDCYFNTSGGLDKAERAYRSALSHSRSAYAPFRGLGECLARQLRLHEAQSAHDGWFSRWIADTASQDFRHRQDAARSRGVPAILLVAMQKSASEYVFDNLQRALASPAIYVTIGTIPRDKIIPSAVRQLAQGGAIARSHMDGAEFPALAAHGITRLLLTVRDPRQVTVSWAHMVRRLSDVEFRYASRMYDPGVPNDFREWSLQKQLDWAVYNYLPGQVAWLESWAAVLDKGPTIPVCVSTFDEFRQDGDAFFRKILAFYGLAPINLPKSADQSAAAMRNFRRGEVDEWRDVLTPQQLKPFNSRLKPLAERFG